MDVELKYIKSLPEETTGQLNDREKNKETVKAYDNTAFHDPEVSIPVISLFPEFLFQDNETINW